MRWPLPTTPPFVSIIIPTKDKTSLLRTTIESITQLSSYQNFEIVVVDNRSQQSETKRYFEEIVRDRRVRVLEYDKEYSFAALNNWAVEQTDAEMVAFVNNDIEVIYPDWLSDMVACASRAEVGAVGARLLYPDGSIQHAGIVMGLGGLVASTDLMVTLPSRVAQTLVRIAETRPADLPGLARVPGMDERRLERFGPAFLDILRTAS